MTTENLKAKTLEGFERMFNQGDLDYVDGALATGAIASLASWGRNTNTEIAVAARKNGK